MHNKKKFILKGIYILGLILILFLVDNVFDYKDYITVVTTAGKSKTWIRILFAGSKIFMMIGIILLGIGIPMLIRKRKDEHSVFVGLWYIFAGIETVFIGILLQIVLQNWTKIYESCFKFLFD